MLSDVVAERVVQLRKAARLSREEFAERCRQLGEAGFSATALTNVETGRRDQEGRRRRKITADELPVFARVLGVPLAWLLADPESGTPVPIVGDTTVDPWQALAWVTGAWPLDEPPGQAWTDAARLLGALRDLYLQVQRYELLRDLYDPQRDPMEAEEESKRQGLRTIYGCLEPFRLCGRPLPPLPDHIREAISELLLDQARERLRELQELRSLGDEWIPPDDAERDRRGQAADTADAKALRRLSESLRALHNFGQPLPPIPDDVLARAEELDVNLTPWLERSQPDS